MAIKFGIVGCGNIGKKHIELASKMGELIGVCDNKRERADEFADYYACNRYYDFKDMLENKAIDVISICTPNYLHFMQTVKSLEADKHVIVEKPMALKVDDCKTMIEIAKDRNKKLFVVKQNRFNPPIVALKKCLDEKRLGHILSFQVNCFWNRDENYYMSSDWKGIRKFDGGTLFTQFSHFVDLITWFFGDGFEVKSYRINNNHHGVIDFEDSGVVILEKYGTIGTLNYTVNSYDRNMEGSITVFGEKGTVKVGGEYLNKLEYYVADDFVPNVPPSPKPNDYGTYQGSMSNHDKVYKNVIEVLMKIGDIAVNGYDGLKTVQLIESIYGTN